MTLRTIEAFFRSVAHVVGDLADVAEAFRGLERRVDRLEVFTGAPTVVDDLSREKQRAVAVLTEKLPRRGAAKRVWATWCNFQGEMYEGPPEGSENIRQSMALCSNLIRLAGSVELAEELVRRYYLADRYKAPHTLRTLLDEAHVLLVEKAHGRIVSRSEAKRIVIQEPGILKGEVQHG